MRLGRIFHLERTMNEQLNLLIQLQEIDGRIRARQEEKKRIPLQIADLDARGLATRAELDKAREAIEEAQKAKRDRDRDLEDGGVKVEKLKARTSEIKNNKEYQAMLKEIETAEKENKTIEEEILKLMERIDAAAAEIKNAEGRVAEAGREIEEDRKKLDEALAGLDSQLSGELATRKDFAARLDKRLLAQYERLYDSKNGRVIVEARNEACSGCFMSIPPQVFVNVKKNESLIDCPHCHRILYYKEAIAPRV